MQQGKNGMTHDQPPRSGVVRPCSPVVVACPLRRRDYSRTHWILRPVACGDHEGAGTSPLPWSGDEKPPWHGARTVLVSRWAVLGSNQRPLPCQGSALPLRQPPEVETGFEPVYTDLQSVASPLGHSTRTTNLDPGGVPAREPRTERQESDLPMNPGARPVPSGRRDSNPRPSPWQGDALPAELRPQRFQPPELRQPSSSITALRGSPCGAIRNSSKACPELQIGLFGRMLLPCCRLPPLTMPPVSARRSDFYQSPSTVRKPGGGGGVAASVWRSGRSSLLLALARAVGAAVAHFVHTEGVAGSNPVPPTHTKPALTR